MMSAISRLAVQAGECCRFHRTITSTAEVEEPPSQTSDESENPTTPHTQNDEQDSNSNLNDSQHEAVVASSAAQVSLIWGPPGTGKTTVVVQILRRLVKNLSEGSKILMTASTNNGKILKYLQHHVSQSL